MSYEGDISSIENIENVLTNQLKTNVKIAKTDELKRLKTPPVIKKYGLTRERCTAYFQDDNVESLTGGYDNIRHICQEVNPNTGIWIKTNKQLTESHIINYDGGMDIYGDVQYENEERVKVVDRYDKKTVLGICLIISMLITSIVYQQYEHEPIFSLIALIALITISIIFTTQAL